MVFDFGKIHPSIGSSPLSFLQPVGPTVTEQVRSTASLCDRLQLMILGPDPRSYLPLYSGRLYGDSEGPCCCSTLQEHSTDLLSRSWTSLAIRDVENQGVRKNIILDIEGVCTTLAPLELPRESIIDHLTVYEDFLCWLSSELFYRGDLPAERPLLNRRSLENTLLQLCAYAFPERGIEHKRVLSLIESFLPYTTEMHQLAKRAKLAALPALDALSDSFAQISFFEIGIGVFLELSDHDICLHVHGEKAPNQGTFKEAFYALSLLTGTPYASLRTSIAIASMEGTYHALAKGPQGESIPGIPNIQMVTAYATKFFETTDRFSYDACIRMDYLPLSLKHLIHSHALSWKEKHQITRDLVKILSSLPPTLIHRDLKSNNIAFRANAFFDKQVSRQPFLIDFAGAYHHPLPNPLALVPKDKQDEIKPNRLNSYYGSPKYSSEEKLQKFFPNKNRNPIEPHTKGPSHTEPTDPATRRNLISFERLSDLYSLGVTLQELYLEEDPSETPFPHTPYPSADWIFPFWKAAGLAGTPIYRIAARLLHPSPWQRHLPTEEELTALDSMPQPPLIPLPGTVREEGDLSL